MKRMEVDSIVLRKSPAILLGKMIATTCVVYGAFSSYSIWLSLGADASSEAILMEKILVFILSVGIEAGAMMVLFLQWNATTYELRSTELIFRQGILRRKQEIHSLRNMQSAYLSQGFFGVLMGFGSLRLHNPLSKEDIIMTQIADPHRCALTLQKMLDALHQGEEIVVQKTP